jgi:hypothetical protein
MYGIESISGSSEDSSAAKMQYTSVCNPSLISRKDINTQQADCAAISDKIRVANTGQKRTDKTRQNISKGLRKMREQKIPHLSN